MLVKMRVKPLRSVNSLLNDVWQRYRHSFITLIEHSVDGSYFTPENLHVLSACAGKVYG